MKSFLSGIPLIGSYFRDTAFFKFKNSLYFNIFILKEFNIYPDIIKTIIITYFELFNPTLHFYTYPDGCDPKLILDGNIYNEINGNNFPDNISDIADINYTQFHKIYLTRKGNVYKEKLLKDHSTYDKLDLTDITKIITFKDLTLCLSRYGNVYIIGDLMLIHKINLDNIKNISIMQDYFMALTYKGDIYKVFLSDIIYLIIENINGSLMYSAQICPNTKKLLLKELFESETIIDIACLLHYNVFLSNLGNIYIHIDDSISLVKINIPHITNIDNDKVNMILLDKNHNVWEVKFSSIRELNECNIFQRIDIQNIIKNISDIINNIPNIIIKNIPNIIKIYYEHWKYIMVMDSSLNIYMINKYINKPPIKLEF